ncbi:MAG TPA: hypothetical protein VLL49_00630 [Anaerolineales bacterium]|nr:hypothetical protein [Anaerolineales bacterium]
MKIHSMFTRGAAGGVLVMALTGCAAAATGTPPPEPSATSQPTGTASPEPTTAIKPTMTLLPFIEGTKFPTGTFLSEKTGIGVIFREDGTGYWYSEREGWGLDDKYGVNGNLWSEMSFLYPGGRKVPVTYYWSYDGKGLTFQLWGADLRPHRMTSIHGRTFLFVSEAEPLPGPDTMAFPTGRFASEDALRAFEFSDDGTWRFFQQDLERPARSGRYVTNGDLYTEMTHDDPELRRVPATYTWTYEGNRLTFVLWGEDAIEQREAIYNNQTYTRVDG